jgi:DNA-binding MarR family transcriptional regulator
LEDYRHAASLRAAIRVFLRRGENVARAAGLTPQRQLLLLIKGAPNGSERATITQLVERLQLRQNTVTELVSRAEDAGLIVREPAPTDRRSVHLRLSADGERRLAQTVTALRGDREHLVRMIAQQGGAQASRGHGDAAYADRWPPGGAEE